MKYHFGDIVEYNSSSGFYKNLKVIVTDFVDKELPQYKVEAFEEGGKWFKEIGWVDEGNLSDIPPVSTMV